MDWMADSTNTDNYINSTVYGSIGQGEGIDLRIELHAILYGGLGKVPKGHWVILKKYNRAVPSSFYNKRSHEGVGGQAFESSNTLLKTRRVPLSKNNEQLAPLKSGIDIENTYIYYFEYTVNPKIGDDILELSWDNHALQPDVNTVQPYEKYRIMRVHPYRLEQGNIQYWMAVAKYDEVTY
jgi:hypothetical protein